MPALPESPAWTCGATQRNVTQRRKKPWQWDATAWLRNGATGPGLAGRPAARARVRERGYNFQKVPTWQMMSTLLMESAGQPTILSQSSK